jgi:hypothetical protein
LQELRLAYFIAPASVFHGIIVVPIAIGTHLYDIPLFSSNLAASGAFLTFAAVEQKFTNIGS